MLLTAIETNRLTEIYQALEKVLSKIQEMLTSFMKLVYTEGARYCCIYIFYGTVSQIPACQYAWLIRKLHTCSIDKDKLKGKYSEDLFSSLEQKNSPIENVETTQLSFLRLNCQEIS